MPTIELLRKVFAFKFFKSWQFLSYSYFLNNVFYFCTWEWVSAFISEVCLYLWLCHSYYKGIRWIGPCDIMFSKHSLTCRLTDVYGGCKATMHTPWRNQENVLTESHDNFQVKINNFSGALVAQWVMHRPTNISNLSVSSLSPAWGKFFSTVNRVPLHTAFHNHLPHHPEILLKKNVK